MRIDFLSELAAETLSFTKQLGFYAERRVKPRRPDDATRLTLVVLARFIEWRQLLRGVQPETLVRRDRQAFAYSGGGGHGGVGVRRFLRTSRH